MTAAVLAGCGREEIKVYTVPKDITEASAQVAPPPPISWKTPSTWVQINPTPLRVGNFTITEGDLKAEMAIIPFPGQVGGELENVNRWRGEIGLRPVNEGEYSSETVQIGSVSGKLFELEGEKQATLAAMLEKEGTSWFFKMRGDKALVAQNKPVLIEFLKSIQFEAAKAHAAQSNASETPAAAAASSDARWQIPRHWKLAPDRTMVIRNWDVGSDGKTANIAISSFEGDVGGVVANVNRWRNELTLPPVDEAGAHAALVELKTDDPHTTAYYLDITGTDRKTGVEARMIAAMAPHGGETWFFKMKGAPEIVEQEKGAFFKLVQTARYHD